MDERITKIKDGIVIDHIDEGKGKEVVRILNLDNSGELSYTLGARYKSKRLDKKDVLKIEGKILEEEELNKIALVVPNATINKISNYEVSDKRKVILPEVVKGIVTCFNPSCITKFENVETKFYIVRKNPLILRCHYCEKSSSMIELV